MEVAAKNPICAGAGCTTRLRNRNVERKTCDRCDLRGVRVRRSASISPDACTEGHVYARTGYTKRRTCFECAYARPHRKPVERWYVLSGFRRLKGSQQLSKIARKAGVKRATLSGYCYSGAMAPEGRIKRIAEALGVSEDELKGVG